MQVFKSKDGHNVTFETFDVYRVLHEILVDYLGDRNYKGRDRHDGLTKEHEELKLMLGQLIRFAIVQGQNQQLSKMRSYINKQNQQVTGDIGKSEEILLKDLNVLKKFLTKNWEEVK